MIEQNAVHLGELVRLVDSALTSRRVASADHAVVKLAALAVAAALQGENAGQENTREKNFFYWNLGFIEN